MPIFLRKYAAAAVLDGIPLIARGSVDLLAAPTLAAGDVKVSLDGGAAADLATLPTVSPSGGTGVRISLSAAETTAKRIAVTFVDQTTPKEWEDQKVIVETFGHASAQHALDLSDGTRAGLAALPAAVAGGAGGLPTADAGNAVKLQSGTGANQISLSGGLVSLAASQAFNLTGNITGSVSGGVGSVASPVTVGTNNDKTGYALAAGSIAAGTFAAGAVNAAALAADAVAEIQAGALTPDTLIDGLSVASIFEALLATTLGVTTVAGNTVSFKKQNGLTTKVTITYGSAAGERTASGVS